MCNPNGGGGGDDGGTPTPTPTPTPIPTPAPSLTPTIDNPQFSYCGGGPNGWYNFFDCNANVTQDIALAIDAPFAGLDAVLITAGCFAGPEGCVAGAVVADTVFNITGANLDETVMSFASAGYSILADLSDDRHLGESSLVSAVAAGAGAISQDPILDFAIDGFGSGYNHNVKPISNFVPWIRSLFNH